MDGILPSAWSLVFFGIGTCSAAFVPCVDRQPGWMAGMGHVPWKKKTKKKSEITKTR